jgi:hypothetical protein
MLPFGLTASYRNRKRADGALTSDLLLKSAITLSPERFGVETKTIGECLACAVRFYEQKQGGALRLPDRILNLFNL